MSPSKTLLALAASLVLVVADSTPSDIFPLGRELVYKFHGDVSAGVEVETSGDQISHFSMCAKLRVLKSSTDNPVSFKIDTVKYSTYNGKGTRGRLPKGGYTSLEFSEDTMGSEFYAIYNNGLVENILFPEEEPLWSRNLKRAIVSQFQIDLTKITTSRAFSYEEHGISGECTVENMVWPGADENHFFLRKFSDMSTCKGRPSVRADNMSPKACADNAISPVSASTERKYELRNEGSDVIIEKIKSRSGISLQLGTESHYHVTNQTLRLESMEQSESVSSAPSSDVTKSLTFEFPERSPDLETDLDMTFGRVQAGHANDKDKNSCTESLETLRTMAGRLDDKQVDTVNPENLHIMDVQSLLEILRSMDSKSLMELSQTVLETDSTETKKLDTIRQLYIAFLPRVGTFASVKTAMKLIQDDLITEDEASDVLGELPFNLRHPDVSMLEYCEKVLLEDKLTHDGVLAFGTMVGKVCEQTSACSDELVDKYVTRFYDQLTKSSDYPDQLVYLQAMGNVRIGRVSELLEPIITGKMNFSHKIRFLAVWASMKGQSKDPEKAYSVYWPILVDKKEHLEMRAAAMTMLLMSKATKERFMNLVWYMSSETSNHLYYLFYTTIKSLVNSKHPCFQHMATAASQVVRMLPEPHSIPTSTGNYILDYKDATLGSGVKLQFNTIADETTGFPTVMFFDIEPHYMQVPVSTYAVHLRIEGEEIWSLMGDDADVKTDLKDILEKLLKIVPRMTKPAHIELLLRNQGRTISAYSFDSETITNIIAVAPTRAIFKLLFGDRYEQNSQELDIINSLQVTYSSDMGVPVVVEQMTPNLMSNRIDISYNFNFEMFTMKANHDFRMFEQNAYGLRTFNPLSGTWHGVKRQRVQSFHAPLNTSLTFDIEKTVAKLHFNWDMHRPSLSYIYHVRTQTFVEGPESTLQNSCPECKQWLTTSCGAPRNTSLDKTKLLDSELEWQEDLVNCESKHVLQDKLHSLQVAMSTADKNFWSDPYSGRALLAFLQKEDIEDNSPESGSCGVVYRLMPVGRVASAEIVIKSNNGIPGVNKDDDRQRMRTILYYKDVEENTIKSWEMTFDGEGSSAHTAAGLKLHLLRNIEGEPHYMVCLKIDGKYPENSEVPWDMLYEDSWASHERKLDLALQAGETEDGKCPQSAWLLNVNLRSSYLERDPEIPSLAKCEADRGQQKLYPATENCVKATEEAANGQNFTLSVKNSNMPKHIRAQVSKVVSILHALSPDEIPVTLPDTFTIHVESSRSGGTKVWLPDSHAPHHGLDFASNVAMFSSLPDLTDAPNTWGDDERKCLAAGGHLMTFDGTQLQAPMNLSTVDWTLFAADCSEHATFAVFVRQAGDPDLMVVRMYASDENLELIPSNEPDALLLYRNGECSSQFKSRFVHVVADNATSKVHVTMKDVDVILELSRYALSVTVPNELSGKTCGLCGDANGNPETLSGLRGPDGSFISMQQVVAEYSTSETLPTLTVLYRPPEKSTSLDDSSEEATKSPKPDNNIPDSSEEVA